MDRRWSWKRLMGRRDPPKGLLTCEEVEGRALGMALRCCRAQHREDAALPGRALTAYRLGSLDHIVLLRPSLCYMDTGHRGKRLSSNLRSLEA